MHWVLLSFVAFFVSGCGLANFTPHQPYEVILNAVEDCEVAPRGMSDPVTFMEVGFSQVRQACESFFVDATYAQRSALLGNKGLDAGLIGTTAIANAISSPADALRIITITAAGIVFAKELINQYNSIYAFGTHLYKVRQLVNVAMLRYADSTLVPAFAPRNYCIAYNYVATYARFCSIASMQAMLDEQVAIDSQLRVPVPVTPVAIVTTPGGAAAPASAELRSLRRAPYSTPIPTLRRPPDTFIVQPAR